MDTTLHTPPAPSTTSRTESAATEPPVRIPAHHRSLKRLGHWTTARHFEVRSQRGYVVLDLRSPRIPAGDIRVTVDLDHAVLRLLVPDDAVVDDWDLHRTGRGRVKDSAAPATASGDRRIVLSGQVRRGEIRVSRHGIAVLSAMWSREFLADLRSAHREGRQPSVADPAHTS